MAASKQLILSKWNLWRETLATLGLLSTPPVLFVAYHVAQLRVNKINLDILELERDKQSYIEYIQPIFSPPNNGTISVTDDFNYIKIPIWQRLGTKRGPKYWARIARTCGPLPRALAVEILSRLHDLPDGVIYSASLACDSGTLLELAGKQGTDVRFFNPPRPCFDTSEHLSAQLYRYLHRLADSTDDDVRYMVDLLLGRTPPVVQEDEFDVEDVEDDDIEFTEHINIPRKSELSPPAQSLASLTMSSLDVMKHHTKEEVYRKSFIYRDMGLQLLTRIWFVFKSNEKMMSKLADVLVNLTMDRESHSVLVSGGFLHMLALWRNSCNKELRSKAASVLSNLSVSGSLYESGVHLLHPIPEDLSGTEVDVVFIHGLNGGTFYTWRQHQSVKDTEDYTTCWPMDWLCEEFGADVRIVGVELSFNATNWGLRSPSDTLSIDEQAKHLADRLSSCNIGGEGRKVVWVGHSMGGIIIKRLLTLAEEHLRYKDLLESTQGVIFMGVPHRGCPVANLTQRTSYIASPTTQMQELANSAKMYELNARFVEAVRERQVTCINFMEGCKTQVKANIRLHVVPPEYSELDIGENVLLPDDNHITICKPRDRDSRLFKALAELLNGIINKPSPDATPNIDIT